jgi:hypothetical protein
MFASIEEFPALEQKRRDPGRIVRVNAPGKFNEGIAFRARNDLRDFYLRHGDLISAAAGRGARPK